MISKFDKLKQQLDDFVDNGGDVNALSNEDELYRYIKNAKFLDANGVRLTVEEIFAICGHERKPKKTKNLKQDLIDQIESYLANGGSFHVSRKSLPFYAKLCAYKKSLKNKGSNLTTQEIMNSLGYRKYSDLYFAFGDLDKMSQFRDENGFVDSYRLNRQMETVIDSAKEALQMPYAVIVQLLCDENLKKSYLEVDYLEVVKNTVLDYIHKNGSLKGFAKGGRVYTQISNLRKFLFTETGEELSTAEILNFLGIEADINLEELSDKKFDNAEKVVKIMNTLYKLAQSKTGENKGKIEKRDIDSYDYIAILKQSNRLGITTKEIFRIYNMDYVNAKESPRFHKTTVSHYPYLQEMRQRRDQLLEESGVSLENGFCKEEVFEKRVEVCQKTFEEFKSKIFASEKNLYKEEKGLEI